MQPEEHQNISVRVGKPEMKSQMGGANKYYVYQIVGEDKFSSFSVWRRFSDFVILKQTIVNRWPGCYSPALPEKKFIGNNQTSFLEIRRAALQNFLNTLSQISHLWYSDEFQLFVKNSSQDVEKSLGNLGKTNPRQIQAKYNTVFPPVPEDFDAEAGVRIMQFKDYLKNVVSGLEKMQKHTEFMTEARMKFIDKYDLVLGTMLHDYEEKCLKLYSDETEKFLFLNQKDNQLKEIKDRLLKAYENSSLSMTNQLIKEEVREINNFNDILKVRDEFQNLRSKSISKVRELELTEKKINAGQSSIFSKIKKQSKEEQLAENASSMEKAREEEKYLEDICRFCEYFLKEVQIEKFKKLRKQNYYRTLKQIARAEKQISNFEIQFWQKFTNEQSMVEKTQKEEIQEKSRHQQQKEETGIPQWENIIPDPQNDQNQEQNSKEQDSVEENKQSEKE